MPEQYDCKVCGSKYTDYDRACRHLIDAHPTLVGEPYLHLTTTSTIERDDD